MTEAVHNEKVRASLFEFCDLHFRLYFSRFALFNLLDFNLIRHTIDTSIGLELKYCLVFKGTVVFRIDH